MYAEVPVQPLHQQPDALLGLDDTRVEYAQLNHNQLSNTMSCNPPQTESQPPHKPNYNGMKLVIISDVIDVCVYNIPNVQIIHYQ